MNKITPLITQLLCMVLLLWGSSHSFAEDTSQSTQNETLVVVVESESEKVETKGGIKGFLKKPASTVVASSPGVDSGAWLNAILGLIAVVSLIFLVAWFVKRFTGFAVSNQQQMRIISAIPVGARERIALVEVADKQILVGITQHNINLLHSFEEPVVNKNDKTRPDFASRLQSILSKSVAETKST